MPRARPLITLTPASARSRASARAKRSPAAEGARAPTIATTGGRQASVSARGRARAGAWLARAQVSEAGRPFRAAALEHAHGALIRCPGCADQGERLRDVLAGDAAAAGEIGDRAREAKHAHLAAGAQASGRGGTLEQLARLGSDAEASRSAARSARSELLAARRLPVARAPRPAPRRGPSPRAGPVQRLGSGASTRTTRSRRSTSGPLRRAR